MIKVSDVRRISNPNDEVGQQFIKALAEVPNSAIFGHQSIQSNVRLRWRKTCNCVFWVLLVPYILFLMIYLSFTIYVFRVKTISYLPETDELNEDDYSNANVITLTCFTIFFALVQLALEIAQACMRGGCSHLKEHWTWIDFAAPLLIFSFGISDLVGWYSEWYVRAKCTLQPFACMLMFLKMMYFMRLHKTTGMFVSMLGRVFHDTYTFIAFYLYMLIAFGFCFYLMSPELDQNSWASLPIYWRISFYAGVGDYLST